ncbi:unnamed protein product, partial [Rangifer tarandus platyrhynchus]
STGDSFSSLKQPPQEVVPQRARHAVYGIHYAVAEGSIPSTRSRHRCSSHEQGLKSVSTALQQRSCEQLRCIQLLHLFALRDLSAKPCFSSNSPGAARAGARKTLVSEKRGKGGISSCANYSGIGGSSLNLRLAARYAQDDAGRTRATRQLLGARPQHYTAAERIFAVRTTRRRSEHCQA